MENTSSSLDISFCCLFSHEVYMLRTTARKDKLILNAPLVHSCMRSAPISTLEKVSLYNKQMKIKLLTSSGWQLLSCSTTGRYLVLQVALLWAERKP